MAYTYYNTNIKPRLNVKPKDNQSSVQAPVASASPGGDAVGTELHRIKTYLNADPARRPPTFDKGRLNGLVNQASISPAVSAVKSAVPFDVAAYRAAILAYLNANAGGFNFAGVGP